MITEILNRTEITEAFEQEFELKAWRIRPAALQISWDNLEGTNNGTISIAVRLSDRHNYATVKTIYLSEEVDSTAFIAIDIFCKEVKISYTANSITSIDMVISAAE
jgi:hypothetical protein